jgi:hypothetical protein
MIVNIVTDLTMYPVEERGKPNLERIAIYANETINTGCYGVMVSHVRADNSAIPFQDNLYWFGDGIINKGDWIFLYTGKGTPKADTWNEPPGAKIYSIHWGRAKTMFANTNIVPILFKVDAIKIGDTPTDVPQIEQAIT